MDTWLRFALATVSAIALVSCAGGGDDDDDTGGGGDDDGSEFTVTSPAFDDGGTVPAAQTCDNATVDAGLSPMLVWTNPPAMTAAFAVTVIDIDADDTAHWGLIDLGPGVGVLAEGVGQTAPQPPGSWATLNYKGGLGYAGPCPPRGDDPHRYVFTVWALDAAVGAPVIEKELADVLPDLEARSLGTATLTGLYGRPE
jgi:Raf kinase inhibitor-like YbhB/YbcL family protein